MKNPTVVRSSAAFDAFQIEPTPRCAWRSGDRGRRRLRQKVDTRTTVLDAPASQVFSPIRQIGGTNGCFRNSLASARLAGPRFGQAPWDAAVAIPGTAG